MGILAKHYFREGWIMLQRGFEFYELEKPLQKLTLLYAYSEKPLYKYTLTEEGNELVKEIEKALQKGGAPFNKSYRIEYIRGVYESSEDYANRMLGELNTVYEKFSTVEIYQGHVVQTYVKGVMCRFYPDEYTLVSKEAFEAYLNDEAAFNMQIISESAYNTKNMKDKVHYLQQRGLKKEQAKRLSSVELKDQIYFTPTEELLQMFCREHEILR